MGRMGKQIGRFGVVWWSMIGLDWFGLVWIGLDWFGLVWIGLDWFGLVWTDVGLVWIGIEIGGLGRSKGWALDWLWAWDELPTRIWTHAQ